MVKQIDTFVSELITTNKRVFTIRDKHVQLLKEVFLFRLSDVNTFQSRRFSL